MGVFKYIYTIYKAEWDKFQHNVHYTSQFDKQNIEKEGYSLTVKIWLPNPWSLLEIWVEIYPPISTCNCPAVCFAGILVFSRTMEVSEDHIQMCDEFLDFAFSFISVLSLAKNSPV